MKKGISLVEVAMSIAIIDILIVGTISYRYHSALLARRTDAKITASRVALLILEDWSGKAGPYNYDPVSQFDSGFAPSGDFSNEWQIFPNANGPSKPSGFIDLDTKSYPDYRIIINRVNYYVKLSYKDEVDKPRILNVTVGWRTDYENGALDSSSQTVSLTGYAH